MQQIADFFVTGLPPVNADETVEIFAFMDAADQSKQQGGRPVLIKDVLEEASRLLPERLKQFGE